MRTNTHRGFTLVEVLVALMIVALSLAALMNSVSSAARGSEYLRDKTIAQWIAMNRIEEVRMNIQKFGENGDKADVEFANRQWRYDTRYFDTDNPSIRRIVVRVWRGDAKKDAGPLAESASFMGSALSTPGSANFSWVNGPSGAGGAPPDQGGPGVGATAPAGTPATGAPAIGTPATGGPGPKVNPGQ
jgi:general secretion pathway protein I